jgi:hypothetical protein
MGRDVQLLVNTVMSQAEQELKNHGRISGPYSGDPPGAGRTLTDNVKVRWQHGEVTAAALVVPVLFGKTGSAARSEAIRLHIEARCGYCADFLMPYRVRPGLRWRRNRQNRVHFSHPVAQESIPRLDEPSAQKQTSC